MSLLFERMQEKQEEERQQEQRGESIRILKSIKKETMGDRELEEAFKDVEKSILNYYHSLTAQEAQSKLGERISAAEKEERDLARKTAHDTLVDRLNILSRLSVKKGRSPNWRKSWGALHSYYEREAITDWVMTVAPLLTKDYD